MDHGQHRTSTTRVAVRDLPAGTPGYLISGIAWRFVLILAAGWSLWIGVFGG